MRKITFLKWLAKWYSWIGGSTFLLASLLDLWHPVLQRHLLWLCGTMVGYSIAVIVVERWPPLQLSTIRVRILIEGELVLDQEQQTYPPGATMELHIGKQQLLERPKSVN